MYSAVPRAPRIGVRTSAHDSDNVAKDFLRRHELDTVRVVFTDLHGVLRGKVFPVSEYLSRAQYGVRFCESLFAKDISGMRVEGLSLGFDHGAQDLLAVPDPSTYRTLPWQPGMGQVIADIVTLTGSVVDYAPRSTLRRILGVADSQRISLQIGSELEFYVVKPNVYQPLLESTQPYELTRLMGHGSFLDTALSALRDMALFIDAVHRESGPGQFEITLRHGPALEVADATVLLRNAIKEIALKQSLIATFMAKPFSNHPGSGYHVHHSLWDPDGHANLFVNLGASDPSPLALQVIGGELRHLPAAMVFLAPSVNGYKRLRAGSAAPVNCTWGFDNRTVAIRVPDSAGRAARLEHRVPGADANPYLAIAAILAGGLLGLRDRLAPPLPIEANAYEATHAVPLPGSLRDALVALEADTTFVSTLGEPLVALMTAVKRAEIEQSESHITPWEQRTYLELL